MIRVGGLRAVAALHPAIATAVTDRSDATGTALKVRRMNALRSARNAEGSAPQ
jgi:hypothetical protein